MKLLKGGKLERRAIAQRDELCGGWKTGRSTQSLLKLSEKIAECSNFGEAGGQQDKRFAPPVWERSTDHSSCRDFCVEGCCLDWDEHDTDGDHGEDGKAAEHRGRNNITCSNDGDNNSIIERRRRRMNELD